MLEKLDSSIFKEGNNELLDNLESENSQFECTVYKIINEICSEVGQSDN